MTGREYPLPEPPIPGHYICEGGTRFLFWWRQCSRPATVGIDQEVEPMFHGDCGQAVTFRYCKRHARRWLKL